MQTLANQIRPISFDDVCEQWNKLTNDLKNNDIKRNGRASSENRIIDYYFFDERLKTRGKNGVSFYEFVNDFDNFKNKPYINNLITFAKESNRYKDNHIAQLYYIFGLAFGRISPFKITNALEIYKMFSPKCVLDPCMGWGGRLLAAMLLDIDYIGCDSNTNLREPYTKLKQDFADKHNSTVILYFKNCLSLHLSKLDYDMVFTSPPYFNIEQYNHMPLKSKQEWAQFYHELFSSTFKNLAQGGTFAINVNEQIYELSLLPLLGEPHTKIPLTKSTRNSTYNEWIYVWIK